MPIEYSRQASKDVDRLPKTVKPRAKAAIDSIVRNPLVGQKLQGNLIGRRRFRVGSYRIIYEYDSRRRLVVIVAIRSRGGAYR